MRHCQACLTILPSDTNNQVHHCSAACKLAASVIADSLDSCWVWPGSKMPSGHGTVRWKGKTHYVHRLMFEEAYGPIPTGQLIRHKCDNAPCCNPDHLELGTNQDNVNDRLQRHGKLSEQDIRDIRSSELSLREAAEEWDINPNTVMRIRKRHTYEWVN